MAIIHYNEDHSIAQEEYVGCVISNRGEHNYYDDSDFYAEVWDEAKGKVVEVIFATTRCASMMMNAVVDATPEILDKVNQWRQKCHEEAIKQRIEEEAKAIRPGRQCRVVKGRKIPKGTLVWVESVFESAYGLCATVSYNNIRVYTNPGNLEVVN